MTKYMDAGLPLDVFRLAVGDEVKKSVLYRLVQLSKVEGSDLWSGPEGVIFNTPQQGINWIGGFPSCRGVIVKARPGAYVHDGWVDAEKRAYNYSLKARNGVVNESEKANRVLINQPQFGYPIFLFSDRNDRWVYEGEFSVAALHAQYVVLERGCDNVDLSLSAEDESGYQEGGKSYVSHLMAERNRTVVKEIKSRSADWLCDICAVCFADRYGVEYIEVHHKIPISTYSEPHKVCFDDFVLLCPNCHKAVHILMRKEGLCYLDIKNSLNFSLNM
ncbi:HNH endonuclease [Pseudomonas abyssi]|uniref:HNH endonuclease n=1 Tax=Pseudomonas abyssi TaxID=170540 RepID=UPI001F34F575|nr:HNH endonuclease [Halopseudomonas gallaeciensis]